MVYQIFNEAEDDQPEGPGGDRSRPADGPLLLGAPAESRLASFALIALVRLALFAYDVLSLPVHFLLQRPHRRAAEARRVQAEQADSCTWIRTDSQLEGEATHRRRRQQSTRRLGATLGEMFAAASASYHSRACLGFRALVTCPVLAPDGQGEHVLQEQSFRSDFTWYTYGQVGQRVRDIAAGLGHHGVRPRWRALFLAGPSLEWFCAAQACLQLAVQLVFAPEIEEPAALRAVVCEARVDLVFVSCDRLPLLCKLLTALRELAAAADQSSDGAGAAGAAPTTHQLNLARIILVDWQFSVDFRETSFAQLADCLAGLPLDTSSILSIGRVEEAGIEHPIGLCCSQFEPGEFSLGPDQLSAALPRPLPADFKQTEGRSGQASQRRQPNGRISQPHDLATLVYSQGPLGQLERVAQSHEQLISIVNRLNLEQLVAANEVHCATAASDGLVEFATELAVFASGGRIGYSSTPNTLLYDGPGLFPRDKSDLEALQPTLLLVRPHALETLRASAEAYLADRLNPVASFVLRNVLLSYRRHWTRRHFATPLVDRLFCARLRRLLGSRLRLILCAGPAESPLTSDFFRLALNLSVVEFCGPPEAPASLVSTSGGAAGWRPGRGRVGRPGATHFDSLDEADFCNLRLLPPKVNKNTFRLNLSRNLLLSSSSTILRPTVGTRVRLEDWQDFRVADEPYPRGRLLLGGDLIRSDQPEQAHAPSGKLSGAQAGSFVDSMGVCWLRTDEIACVFPDGRLTIISALSDMMRLDDGQYISLSQIERVLRSSQFVDNVCATLDLDRRLVVSLVVPNLRRLALKSPGRAQLKMPFEIQSEPEELNDIEFRREVCSDRLLCDFVATHLAELAAAAGLGAIPHEFHLVPESWTPDNGLATRSSEPRRAAIQKFYAQDIRSILSMQSRRLSAKRLSARRKAAAAINILPS